MLSLFQKLSPPPEHNFWYSMIGQRTAAGINVTNDVAMGHSTAWACTSILSASGATLPFGIHERVGDTTRVASEHVAHSLIHSEPNDEMGTVGMRTIGFARQINEGNFFAEIQRDRLNRPVALWPIDYERVKPVRPDEQLARTHNLIPNKLAWRVRNDSGTYDYLRDADMFNVRSIHGKADGVMGIGIIEKARETIAHGIALTQQGAAYFKNSARPSIVIEGGTFGRGPGETREDYRRMWNETHGGPENNAKPALLPPGATMKVLSYSPEDSQFIQTMQNNVEEMCRWYRVSPHLVQHLLRSTFSNIEHQGIDFVVYSLIPWLKMWEEEVNRKLLSPTEKATYYAKHNVNGLLRGDSAARAAYYQALWQLGAYSINEIRELEDLNPIEGGDEHFVQTSYATIANVINPPQPPAPVVPEQKPDETMATITSTINGFLEFIRDDREQRDPPPIINVPAPTLPDELAKQLASLIEYTKPPVDDHRIADVQLAACQMVESVVTESLALEIQKVGKILSGDASGSIAAIDTYYGLVSDKLAERLSQPVFAYARSRGASIDSGNVARSVAESHLAAAKEQVLELTSCQPDEWPHVRERFSRLAVQWKESRSLSLIQSIDEIINPPEPPSKEAQLLAAISKAVSRPVELNLKLDAAQGPAGPVGPKGDRGDDGRDGRDGREGPKGDRGEAVTPEINVLVPEPKAITFQRDEKGNIIKAERE